MLTRIDLMVVTEPQGAKGNHFFLLGVCLRKRNAPAENCRTLFGLLVYKWVSPEPIQSVVAAKLEKTCV